MNKPTDENPWRAAALVGTLGIDLAVCLAVGFWIGRMIAEKLDNPLWVLGGVLLGLASGIVSVVMLLKRFVGGRNG